MPLLTVENANVTFHSGGKPIKALDDVSVTIEPGECVAVVGESGSGKTTLARAILGLQPLDSGRILMEGQPVEPAQLAKKIGIVWQDPYASLDPRWTVKRSIAEPGIVANAEVDVDRVIQEVGLDLNARDRYPHQMSGGQRQRVAIARALALRPPLVICDEPTAALDLSIQAQILNLVRDIQEQQKCAFLYISHDLLTVQFLAHRIVVMRNGKVVESGLASEVFANPQERYTQELIAAAPSLDRILAEHKV